MDLSAVADPVWFTAFAGIIVAILGVLRSWGTAGKANPQPVFDPAIEKAVRENADELDDIRQSVERTMYGVEFIRDEIVKQGQALDAIRRALERGRR